MKNSSGYPCLWIPEGSDAAAQHFCADKSIYAYCDFWLINMLYVNSFFYKLFIINKLQIIHKIYIHISILVVQCTNCSCWNRRIHAECEAYELL